MKQKLKKLSIVSLLLSAFVIFSCSEDYEVHDHNHNESKIKVKPITIQDVSTNARALEKLTNPKSRFNRNTSTDRIIIDSINNFSIDTDYGLYIEDGDYHSYTFKITRPNGSNYLLENVVVSKKNDTEYETILYQYNITEQELDMIDDGEFVNLEGKMNRVFLENSIITSEVTGKYYFNGHCYEDNPVFVAGTMCRTGRHSFFDGSACEYFGEAGSATYGYHTWQTTLVPCDDGGGGGVGGTSSYSGGSGGTGGVTTSPVNNCKGSNCITEEGNANPCEKVKNQFTNNPTLQDKLNTLSGNTTANTERGFHKLSNSNIIQNAGVGVDGSVLLPTVPNGAKCTILAHTHNAPAANTYSIFSWADLEAFAKLLKLGKLDANSFTAFLATADGTYYALTIENTQNFLQFFAIKGDPLFDINIATKRVEQAKIYFGELASFNENIVPIIDYNTDPLDDEKAFLDLLQDNNLGVSLFESNATFTTFEKVTHNKTTGNIDKTPCN